MAVLHSLATSPLICNIPNFDLSTHFQANLFLGITTLLLWLKSNLLLKNKCFCTTIYMKTLCLQTNDTQHCLGKESSTLGAGGGVERVALIKSLIYVR